MSEFIKLKTSMSYYGLMYARIEEMMSDPWELGCKGIIRKERLEEALSAIRHGTLSRANPRSLYITKTKVYLSDILKVTPGFVLETWQYRDGVPKNEIVKICGNTGREADLLVEFFDREKVPQPDAIYEGASGLFNSAAKAPKDIEAIKLDIRKVKGGLRVEIIDDEEPAKEERLSPREKAFADYIIEEITKRLTE